LAVIEERTGAEEEAEEEEEEEEEEVVGMPKIFLSLFGLLLGDLSRTKTTR